MPRPPNTDERRAQIAAGLIQVMARRGYDGASINEIAKEAGLTSGLIHYHFKNKQEILLAALDGLVSRHQAGLEACLSQAPRSAPAQLAAFIDLHLGLGATADPAGLACWILISGEALRQPEVQARYALAISTLVGRLRTIVEQGLTAGLFAGTTSAEAASAILAAIQGYFVLAAATREIVPRGSAAPCVVKMAEGLLGSRLPAVGRRRS